MSDHTYEYVECNCCGDEARKQHAGFGGGADTAPPGWIEVNNRDHRKLWDLCPECHKAFTEWLLKRAGHIVETLAARPESVVRAFCDGLVSPDTDFRSRTERVIQNTADHMRRGLHDPEKST